MKKIFELLSLLSVFSSMVLSSCGNSSGDNNSNSGADSINHNEVLHTVTIGYGYNEIPGKSGDFYVEDETGYKFKCSIELGVDCQVLIYNNHIDFGNDSLSEKSVRIFLYIPCVSKVTTTCLANTAAFYSFSVYYSNGSSKDYTHFSDLNFIDEAHNCSYIGFDLPIEGHDSITFTNIVIEYYRSGLSN